MKPIRVLHILHSMNRGGAENAIMNYYRNLNREEIQFDFLLTDPNKSKFEDEIGLLGGIVYRVPRLTLLNPFKYIRAVSLFFKFHPEYTIVHSHTSSKSFVPLYLAKKKGIPVRISHSHNSRTEKGLYGFIRDGLKPFLKLVSNNWFACGKDAGIWLYGKKASMTGKIRVWPNVIECSKFDFNAGIRKQMRSHLGISDNTTLMVMTARFTKIKNQQFAIQILDQLLKKGVNAKLVLIGDGETKYLLENFTQNLSLSDKVIFTGVIPNVYDYEQAADIFLLTSFFEGIPLSAIEAQVSGLKCFISTGCPKETDLTGLCSFLPLSMGAEYWAQELIKQIPYDRRSHLDDVRKSGYDAEYSAVKLQKFYQDSYNNEKSYHIRDL